MIAFIDFPWWLGALAVLLMTAPAGAAGAAALPVWRARRGRDAVAWSVLGYLLASALTTVLALTLTGSWGRSRAIDGEDLFWSSVAVGVVLLVLAVWGVMRRRVMRRRRHPS